MPRNGIQYKQMLDQLDISNTKYWIENNPIVSDEEYDAFVEKILTFEQAHPKLIDKTRSPNHTYDMSSSSKSVVHTQRMYSLGKGYNQVKLRKWYDRVSTVYPLASFYVDPKLDGVALDLWYRDYHLVKILTRGTNGIAGEDITHQMSLFHSIPKQLPPYPYLKDIDIRGEATLCDMVFRHHIQDTYPNTYSNSRSAVSGLLMSTVTSSLSAGYMSFSAYGAVFHTETPFKTHAEIQTFLHLTCKFTVPTIYTELIPTAHEPVSFEKIWDCVTNIERNRKRVMCAADGVVVRLNTLSEFEHFGYTDHHPVGAIAYKFKPLGENTTLTKIVYQVTKTGKLTPVGIVNPVRIGGTTISSVNLHNEDYIAKLGLKVGDMVHIVRQGDAIPMIESVLLERREFISTSEHVPPTVCVSCGQPLVRPHKSCHLYCVNPNCPAIFLENIVYFTSKNGLNVRGIGTVVWQRLIEIGRIRTYNDIFTLTDMDFLFAVGPQATDTGNAHYSELTCERLARSLTAAWKKLTLAACLTGLGIPRIGRGVAGRIENHYPHYIKLLDALEKEKPNNLTRSEWKALQDYFSSASNKLLLRYIFNHQPV